MNKGPMDAKHPWGGACVSPQRRGGGLRRRENAGDVNDVDGREVEHDGSKQWFC